jgi:hypothetical protein
VEITKVAELKGFIDEKKREGRWDRLMPIRKIF